MMKKYTVQLNYNASIIVDVEVENSPNAEGEALEKARGRLGRGSRILRIEDIGEYKAFDADDYAGFDESMDRDVELRDIIKKDPTEFALAISTFMDGLVEMGNEHGLLRAIRLINNKEISKALFKMEREKWDKFASEPVYESGSEGGWFDEKYGFLQKDIPEECVMDCSGPGRKDDAVAYWVDELKFYIPQPLIEKAKNYLREFGAWEEEELDQWAETEDVEHQLAQHILWCFCCDLREGNLEAGELYLGH